MSAGPYPVVEQPEAHDRDLHPHQLTSIFNMEVLEREQAVSLNGQYSLATKMGIQADMTGYGKTASMVGLIMRDKMQWDNRKPYYRESVHSCDGLVKVTRKFQFSAINTTLIVAGQSIVSQWVAELGLTNLSVTVIKTRRRSDSFEPGSADVVICTPTMFNRLVSRLNKTAWKRFVYDEPTVSHIPSMETVTAGFTWLVTATPEDVRWRYAGRNHGHYLGSMNLDVLGASFFAAITIKNPNEYVTASWCMPPVHHVRHQCFQPLSRTVNGLVPAQVEKMVSAGNIRGAIVFMGGTEADSIVDVVRKRLEEDLTEARQKIQRYQLREDQPSVEHWSTKEKRTTSKLAELDKRFSELLNSPCHVCIEKLCEPVLAPCCQNLFCGECLLTWLKRKEDCPLCRRCLHPSSLIYVKELGSAQNLPVIERPMTKPERIVEIAKSRREGRLIVFSEEDATYSIIKQKLAEEGIICKEIKGRVETRERLINTFKSKGGYVLFLNAKNNGAGIDLQECTDIVLYHKMAPSSEQQILGRANRIGRDKDLYVHHLIVQCRLT